MIYLSNHWIVLKFCIDIHDPKRMFNDHPGNPQSFPVAPTYDCHFDCNISATVRWVLIEFDIDINFSLRMNCVNFSNHYSNIVNWVGKHGKHNTFFTSACWHCYCVLPFSSKHRCVCSVHSFRDKKWNGPSRKQTFAKAFCTHP